MSAQEMISKMKKMWHHVSRNYNAILLEGCLDRKLKEKLQQKITYHTIKLNELM